VKVKRTFFLPEQAGEGIIKQLFKTKYNGWAFKVNFPNGSTPKENYTLFPYELRSKICQV